MSTILSMYFRRDSLSNYDLKKTSIQFNIDLLNSILNSIFIKFNIFKMFKIDSCFRLFDRESRSSYYFLVVATDGGRYDSRSARVPVTIAIEDVNDNSPVFSRYPFSVNIPVYTQPGKKLS